MEQEVAQVVAGRLHAEELAIEHDGEPGEGMPGAADRIGEGPANASPGESMAHIAVLGNEGGVIDVNEAVVDGRQENPGDLYKEQDAEDGRAAGGGSASEDIGHPRGPVASACE